MLDKALPVPSLQPLPPLASDAGTSRLLLCVTDNAEVSRREVVPVLREIGYEVELADPGALERPDLNSRPYALIILDVLTPEGPAFQFCEHVSKQKTLPVMLVLHGAARNEVLRGYALGADAYVLAPFDREELVARLRALLRRRSPVQRSGVS